MKYYIIWLQAEGIGMNYKEKFGPFDSRYEVDNHIETLATSLRDITLVITINEAGELTHCEER